MRRTRRRSRGAGAAAGVRAPAAAAPPARRAGRRAALVVPSVSGGDTRSGSGGGGGGGRFVSWPLAWRRGGGGRAGAEASGAGPGRAGARPGRGRGGAGAGTGEGGAETCRAWVGPRDRGGGLEGTGRVKVCRSEAVRSLRVLSEGVWRAPQGGGGFQDLRGGCPSAETRGGRRGSPVERGGGDDGVPYT